MSDRTVHATLANGDEIVRYDRAGKWYIEYAANWEGRGRKPLTLAAAASLAAGNARWYSGRSGGSQFDAKVRRLRSSS